jgi:hypothetical protein
LGKKRKGRPGPDKAIRKGCPFEKKAIRKGCPTKFTCNIDRPERDALPSSLVTSIDLT